ncbi:MAG TPA: Ldh family oxidoreductase [Planctomycetota bacterium]|nr:Ldh family oxidoreductase [Planctomycetota bacterium]
MPRISVEALTAFGTALLVKKGVAEADARHIASVAVLTEARGVSTHGTVALANFDEQVGRDIDPAARPKIVREKGATALLDGQRCFGQLCLRLAAELAVRKAREHGLAMVGCRNTSWIAGLGTYLLPVAEQGLLGQLWAQSSSCKDCAPVGGIDGRFSTNPVALAFPGPDGPVVADFSTAVMSFGRARRLAAAGKRGPAPVFLDPEGHLTDDPQVAVDRDGTLLFMGGELEGYKGYAFSLWSEALAAMGGGSANNPELPGRQNFNLTVIDPEAFAGNDYFRKEMGRFVAHVKSSRRRAGVDAIRLPGDRARECFEDSRRRGVELTPALFERLGAIAAKHGLAPLAALPA